MERLNLLLLDDTISGTGVVWTSSQEHQDVLGMYDQLAMVAKVSEVRGTSAALSVQIEHSADGQHWIAVDSATQITNQLIQANDQIVCGYDGTVSTLGFIRVTASLGGTAPGCRLKLTATARSFG